MEEVPVYATPEQALVMMREKVANGEVTTEQGKQLILSGNLW
jgi:hypothetical protein